MKIHGRFLLLLPFASHSLAKVQDVNGLLLPRASQNSTSNSTLTTSSTSSGSSHSSTSSLLSQTHSQSSTLSQIHSSTSSQSYSSASSQSHSPSSSSSSSASSQSHSSALQSNSSSSSSSSSTSSQSHSTASSQSNSQSSSSSSSSLLAKTDSQTNSHSSDSPQTKSQQSGSSSSSTTAVLALITTPITITASSTTTVPGVTINTHVSTTDSSGHNTVVPVFWHCWFCGGGAVLAWGLPTAPGIYPPPVPPPVPNFPTVTVGNDGNPTPDPSSSQDPTKTDTTAKQTSSSSQESSKTQTTSKQSSSSSSCEPRTVTDAFVSCAPSTSGSSRSCFTTTSVVSGCSSSAFTTTTTGSAPACSKYIEGPDEAEGASDWQDAAGQDYPTYVGNLTLSVSHTSSKSSASQSFSRTATSSASQSSARVTSSSASSTITAAPICNEGNNKLMGFNNEPSSWCFCGGRGPFSTINGSTSSYCAFSTLPTQTISLTSHSTSINTACVVTSATVSLGASPTLDTYCQCGETMVGIQTTTNSGGTGIVACGSKTISTIAPKTTSAAPTPLPTEDKLTCYGTGGTDWWGEARQSFPRDTGVFSIEHLCGTDGPEYTANSTYKVNGVYGYAGDRFWFDRDNKFCMSTNIAHGLGYWEDETTGCLTGVRDLMLNVAFSVDQTGCAPMKGWSIPKGQDCKDIFYKLLDNCDTNTQSDKNGGVFTQNTENGCVDWRLWSIAA